MGAALFKASDAGVFVAHKDKKFRDILDGQSNTIMAGEIATDLGDRAISPYNAPVWDYETASLLARLGNKDHLAFRRLSGGHAISVMILHGGRRRFAARMSVLYCPKT